MKGVELGQVDSVGFVSAAYDLEGEDLLRYGNWVVVRFTVYPDALHRISLAELERAIKVRIQRGMRVRLASQGVTGIKYLEVDELDPARHPPPFAPPWTPREFYIPSAPGAFTEIMDSIGDLTDKLGNLSIEEMTSEVQALVASVKDGIEAAGIGEIGQGASQVLADLHGILNGPDLQATLANLRETAASSKQLMAKVDALIESEGVRGSVANLHDATGDMKTAMERLPATIARLDASMARLEEFLAAGRPDLETLMTELRMTIVNVRELTDVAKRYPASLVFGEMPAPANPQGEKR
jgi:ABC-type transporter Mla subunit MlaD